MNAPLRVARVHSYAVGRWRECVTTYDLGNEPPRPFLDLDLHDQAFIVARLAMRELQPTEQS
jgi:hypothetical protein